MLSMRSRKAVRSPKTLPTPIVSSQSKEDEQRAKERYKEAVQLLTDSIQKRQEQWGSFEFLELTGEPKDFDDNFFLAKINATLKTRKTTIKDQTSWTKCSEAVQCFIKRFSPLAKNFLLVAKEVQAIPLLNPYGLLCGGLLLLITIAEKEAARKEGIRKTLDYICQQITHLKVIETLPKDLEQLESVFDRALDVRSASMIYLAVHINHDATRLGTLGKIFKVAATGEERLTESAVNLKASVEDYNRTLGNAHLRLDLETNKLAKEIVGRLNEKTSVEPEVHVDKFIMIPYERNPRFTGRKQFLETLKEKLFDQISAQYNHRVALYGLGGIGKTQITIEYIYSNESLYDRIFWITAIDQAALLSGYQRIAQLVSLSVPPDSKLTDVAKYVMSWLRRQERWLIILDNLDVIEVADGFLPPVGPNKHTLITTRNPNSDGIPAEGLEVPLLDNEEAVELLVKLSKVPTSEDAVRIVDELGYLPLAIEQAAAYVREVARDFTRYRTEYHRNRKELHGWVGRGNRPYPHSVRTTWSMSFKIVQSRDTQAANLLRIFAFLNPDNILLHFLRAGIAGFADDLQHVLTSEIRMAKALLELENLSLIKWDRLKNSISVHRLVQVAISDEMTATELTSYLDSVIDICDEAFPQESKPKEAGSSRRHLCRKYQSQVVEPLLRIADIKSSKATLLKGRVANFLLDEGKYMASKDLFAQAAEIGKDIWTAAGSETLRLNQGLATAYLRYGDITRAISLYERVIDVYEQNFGLNDIGMFDALNGLGNAYETKGDYDTALSLYERALSFKNQVGKYRTASTINNIGNIHRYKGCYPAATQFYKRALDIRECEFGVDHIECLSSINNIGTICNAQGRSEEAISYYKRGLGLVDREFGEDHIRSAQILQNLGNASYWLERYDEAISYSTRAVVIIDRELGPGHLNSAEALKNLGNVAHWQERYDEAIGYYRRALEILEEHWGVGHIKTADTISNLGDVYLAQGKDKDALLCVDQALEIYRGSGKFESSFTATINTLAGILHRQGDTEKAVRLFEDSLRNDNEGITDKQQLEHKAAACDGPCSMFPLKGIRHKCRECADYDLCSTCFEHCREIHNPRHSFFQIPRTDWKVAEET